MTHDDKIEIAPSLASTRDLRNPGHTDSHHRSQELATDRSENEAVSAGDDAPWWGVVLLVCRVWRPAGVGDGNANAEPWKKAATLGAEDEEEQLECSVKGDTKIYISHVPDQG